MFSWAALLAALLIGLQLGFWLGRSSTRLFPPLDRLSEAQRRQVENALAARMPFWVQAAGILIACLGCPLVIGVWVADISPALSWAAFFAWVGAFAIFAVIGIRRSGRIVREELERMSWAGA